MRIAPSARAAALPIATFFIVKLVSGLLLLKLSAALLGVSGFAVFSQLLLLGALVSMVAVAGAQNGIVREVAVGTDLEMRRSTTAAIMLWIGVFALAMTLAFGAAGTVSRSLTGSGSYGWAVTLVLITAVMSGPAQIGYAALTGLGRTRASLSAQAVGLVAGTAFSSLQMVRGDPAWAAVAFYAGSLAGAPPAAFFLRHVVLLARFEGDWLRQEIIKLLRYSGGFVAVASSSMLTLFALRYVYLGAFDNNALGYWLMAQRISDTSTQLLGLFMIQYVVPTYASAVPERRDRLVLYCWLIASGTMALALITFSLAPAFWVRQLLAETFVPAIPGILIYMCGDIARATASLAMHVALARASNIGYASVELSALAMMAAITLVLIASGARLAPMIGYALSYVVVGFVTAGLWMHRTRLSRHAT